MKDSQPNEGAVETPDDPIIGDLTQTEPCYLPELSDEELLKQFQAVIKSGAVARTSYIWGYFLSCCIAIPVAMIPFGLLALKISEWGMDKPAYVLPIVLILSIFTSIGVGLGGAILSWKALFQGRSKAAYNLLEDRHRSLFKAISQRKMTEAFPELFSLLIVDKAGYLAWDRAKPLLFETTRSLLGCISYEDFGLLSSKTKHDLIMLLFLPDEDLRNEVSRKLVELGDKQTLGWMQYFQRMFGMNRAFEAIGFEKLQYAIIHKISGLRERPFATTGEMLDCLDLALKRLKARLEEDGKTAQLLRASDYNPAMQGAELLRAATGIGEDLHPETLLRPASDKELTAAEIAAKYTGEDQTVASVSAPNERG